MQWLSRAAAACMGAVLAAAPQAASAQNPVPTSPATIDGPSAEIVGLSGMSIARDGTGGVVYLKNVSGVQHVFVSRLQGGVFQPPQQVDATLPGASSQPVIAAGNGGLLLIAFINSGSLYAVDRGSSSSSYQAPIDLAASASNPSMQMSTFDKAYLAFTAASGGGDNVRAAYYYEGRWSLESAPLNASPGDNAGTGLGRPEVATAGDGIGTVVWGEAGHIYSRRVWGTSPSIVFEQADVPSLSGWSEVSANQPSAGAGGDSSFVGVIFDETLTNGSQQQSRVLMNRLQGSRYDGVTQVDGLTTPGSDQADQPQIAMGEYGGGLATSARETSNQVFAGLLGSNGQYVSTTRVDSLSNLSPPNALPAAAGLTSFVVAWQQDGGVVGGPEIRARYYANSSGFGPEVVVSSAGMGATNAESGLADGGDVNGDVAVAWVQGSGSSTQIVAAQLYQPPSAAVASKRLRYEATTTPLLAWNPTNDSWGPVRYAVTVDGALVGSTAATTFRVPLSLTQGPHSWYVTATNPADLQSTSQIARVWVDTVPPALTWKLSGKRKAHAALRIAISYTDAPAGQPAQDASGIATVVIHWGDGSSSRLTPVEQRTLHVYVQPGSYRLTVVVKDRAGNTTTVARGIRIRRG